MSLTKFELKKIVHTPLIMIAFVALVIINICSLLFGSQTGYKAIQSPFDTNINEAKQNGSFFAGEINDEWYQSHKQDQKEFIDNPANHVSDNEKQRIQEELIAEGFSEQEINDMGNFIYLRKELISSNEYNRYEDIEVAINFYQNADAYGKMMAYQYKNLYSGEKGEILAAKAEEMYGNLATNFTAYYNYDLGYWKLRNIHSSYPFSIGLLVLIGLAPIFSAEYSRKTDAILLSSKYGKKKLIFSKIKAGLIFAIAVWGLIEIINTLIIVGIYGTTGAEAYWQNFVIDCAPFPFNQLQITLVTIATSLLGIVYFASVIMLISVCSKNQFVSLLMGGVILLVPYLDFAFTDNSITQNIYNFMPTRILTSINEWQQFDLVYFFGNAVPIQYVVIITSLIISLVAIFLCYIIFKRKQVEN